ncbi:hypothetical protein GS429_18480 [Natronorubrum sp. JWXQ-INN-674]|uniref:Uncharacterized protein n=1 Tax=Natronorubrum halalkaliphilum TaxID=2691917 RepID=A0A6B0VSA7_9EURY|nr:hypothetical protein [Natronorubrum halalkaliphilum]MXV64013.1 hypothetical protein [Natronorubrum halalkaliphilum]
MGTTLPRTPIEWYMLGFALVVGNIFVLLMTDHGIVPAVAMGLFYGLGMALVILLVVAGWHSFRGTDDTADAESTK